MTDQPHWYGAGPHITCSECEFCEQCGPSKRSTPCEKHPRKGSDQT